MKRCSTCNRTYTDPNLSFCIDDGTPLTTVDADDDATVVTPSGTENATAYQPPRSYVPPGAPVKRRRLWPWVVGIFGAFILGILVIGLAAAFLAPRMMRRLEPQGSNTRGNANTSQPANSNTAEANVNSTENVNTPPPTDHDQVLAQLKDLENEWTVANFKADKQKLDRILADDFVGGAQGEPLQSKADYIRDIEPDTSVDKWEFNDLKLMLLGDRAVLTGTITYFISDQKRVFEFVDKFVWRDGRWQATGAVIGEKENPGVAL